MENVQPQILIGQDNWRLGIPKEVIDVGGNSPVLTKTNIGWVIHGKIDVDRSRIDKEYTYPICCHYGVNEEDILHRLVKEYFNLDSIGVKICTEKQESRENVGAKEIMDATFKYCEDGKWKTGLLWKQNVSVLPESKTTAIRLLCMERKMDKDAEFAKQYKEKI